MRLIRSHRLQAQVGGQAARTEGAQGRAGKKKLWAQRRNAGFTLGEVLVTVILVGLVTSCMAVAVSFGTTQYAKSLTQSDSEMLYSSLENVLSDRLSCVSQYKLDAQGNVAEFWDGTFTYGSTICYVDASNTKLDSAPGQIALYGQDGTKGNCTKRLLGSGSYTHNLVASVTSLTYDADSQNFTVGLAIQSGSDTLVSGTFTVKALNDPQKVAA